jgi:cell division cycle protein 20 (cofactor of APC complex)
MEPTWPPEPMTTCCASPKRLLSILWYDDDVAMSLRYMIILMIGISTQTTAPKYSLSEHQAAVKALAWSPHERNLLASGGGTADRCIKFWNASSGSMISSVDTGSQVCALQWSPHEKELLSR